MSRPTSLGARFGGKIKFYSSDLRTANVESVQLALGQDAYWKYSWKTKRLLLSDYRRITWILLIKRFFWVKGGIWKELPADESKRNRIQKRRSQRRSLIKQHFQKHLPWQGIYDLINWKRVRSVGELSALTRISYYSLFVVPLLAGIWLPVQAWILSQNNTIESSAKNLQEIKQLLQDPPCDLPKEAWEDHKELLVGQLDNLNQLFTPMIEKLGTSERLQEVTISSTMPTGWFLAFLAALAIWVGHAVYQIWAPELIRTQSENDLIERANEINRLDEGISDERLRQAIDYLDSAARKLSHRHTGFFVKRENRIVWIPDKVDERFEDKMVDPPTTKDNSTKQKEGLPKGNAIPEEEASRDENNSVEQTNVYEIQSGQPLISVQTAQEAQPEKVKSTHQEVDANDRKRITIEEGQKARYDQESFRERKMAWTAGGLYILGGWFLASIILRQLGYVIAVSPVVEIWPIRWFAYFSGTLSFLWGLTTTLGAILIIVFTWYVRKHVPEP